MVLILVMLVFGGLLGLKRPEKAGIILAVLMAAASAAMIVADMTNEDSTRWDMLVKVGVLFMLAYAASIVTSGRYKK